MPIVSFVLVVTASPRRRVTTDRGRNDAGGDAGGHGGH